MAPFWKRGGRNNKLSPRPALVMLFPDMNHAVKISLIFGAALSLAACTSYRQTDMKVLKDQGEYWQRADVTEATYMEGPKVQQLLHRDISRCVAEIREEVRLGQIKRPVDKNTAFDRDVVDKSVDRQKMDRWDTPDHNGYLLAEHNDYDDFETCMQAKGWERLEHVPYSVAQKSRENYIEAVTGEHYRASNPDAADNTRDESSGSADPKANTKDSSVDQPGDGNFQNLNH